jgi:hypothetical protein
MSNVYKACDLRNSGEAFRRFRSSGIVAGAHETLVVLLRHKAVGGILALMGAAGLVGGLITFLG